MGLRPGAVSRIVNELLQSGLVIEGAKGASKGGRKPTYLYIETRRRYAIAVDISASHTSLLATDLLGHPLMDVNEFPTGRQPDSFVADLGARIGRIRAENPDFGECVGVGVVVSGLVDLAGEGRALETLRETGYYLGRGFATIIKSIDPSRVYVGGEITIGWDLLASMVRDALREQALTPEAAGTTISVVQLSEHPRLRGAAALVHTPAFAAPTIA
jgi:predicted NBD/HSP70 family sugar kinase